MDKDVPDFYDIDQDEMYEHQYADDLDVLEDFEGTIVIIIFKPLELICNLQSCSLKTNIF